MNNDKELCERWRWLGIRLKEEGMHQQGDALIQAAARIEALNARVAELEERIDPLQKINDEVFDWMEESGNLDTFQEWLSPRQALKGGQADE